MLARPFDQGRPAMRRNAVVLAAILLLIPLGARAADLVVWWDKPLYAQEEQALHETVAAFERKAGKQVQLVFHPANELPGKLVAALASGQPPDFAFGDQLENYVAQWAFEHQLVDLTDTVAHFSDMFDPYALAWVTWRDAKNGQKSCMGCSSVA
jgi:ABC-type glycerol-3-phosphate transport system substrate-binding protein